jgi:hypothetical protein
MGMKAALGSILLLAVLSSQVGGSADTASRDPHVQTPERCGRLSARGVDIVCSDGSRFRWRGVTAFALLEQLAHGRSADADAYMRWARAAGFNLVRVLAMADGLFRLSPDEGRLHMPTLFAMAARHGLYVEIVALADTARYRTDLSGLREQVTAVGAAAAACDNVVVQIANEHYHPTQSQELHTLATLRDLGGLIPERLLYTASAAAQDTAREPQGEYITRHLSRAGEGAKILDRVRLLGILAVETGKPVVNGEPIGAAERVEPGRRLAAPEFFRALGRRQSEAGLAGGTFHCEDCMYARTPGPVQQACAQAWIQGFSVSAPSVRRSP